MRTATHTLVASLLLAAGVTAAGCGTSGPAHVQKRHGLGGSSLVYVEEFDASRTQAVGASLPQGGREVAARLRARLLTDLREMGMQTRDSSGSVPADGLLVRGTIDTIDGGSGSTLSVAAERLHCSVSLWNGAVSRGVPAFDLKITGTPSLPVGVSSGILGAADDAADQIAKFIRENP